MARGRERKNKLPPFVALTWELLNSKAYKDLTPTAKGVLPYFLGKIKRPLQDPQYYQENFIFPYAEAVKLGYAKKTFYRAINSLYQFGFVDIIEIGGLRGSGKTSSKFKLANRWKGYGLFSFQKADRGKIVQAQIKR